MTEKQAPKAEVVKTAGEVIKTDGPDKEVQKKEEEAAKLDLHFLASAVTLPPTLADVTAPTRARSEKQQKMDEIIVGLHKRWAAAGKPTMWAKVVAANVVTTYFVEPEKAAELHQLIKRAVDHHGFRANYGTAFKVSERHVKEYGLPASYLGREAISFAVQDKRPRVSKPTASK